MAMLSLALVRGVPWTAAYAGHETLIWLTLMP